jgi:hypothetical protein
MIRYDDQEQPMILYLYAVYNTSRRSVDLGGEVSRVGKDERKPPRKPIPKGPKPT